MGGERTPAALGTLCRGVFTALPKTPDSAGPRPGSCTMTMGNATGPPIRRTNHKTQTKVNLKTHSDTIIIIIMIMPLLDFPGPHGNFSIGKAEEIARQLQSPLGHR